MLLDNRLEPARKAFIRLGFGFQYVTGKDHLVFVGFHHVGHTLVRRRPDGRHRGLCFLVGFDPNFVDPVRDVLLLRRFQDLVSASYSTTRCLVSVCSLLISTICVAAWFCSESTQVLPFSI